MGEVWGAFDHKLGRRVAMKFVRFPDGVPDQELAARFTHEARTMARLAHPGMPAIHDFGVYDDRLRGRRHYLVMRFIEGAGINDVVAEHGPLPVGWVASIGAQVAAVLVAAHEQGILHRDLKPANLMLCRDGSVMVVDFGLAVLHDPDVTRLTRTGQRLGTASYMAPEQVSDGVFTVRSDLYALGCVLHELLTGRCLFSGPSEFSVMEQHVNRVPEPVSRHRDDVPAGLDELVLSMLEKQAADRPGSAAEVHARLLPYLGETGGLGDMTAPGPSAHRMYATALSRTLPATSVAPVPVAPVGGPEPDGFGRGDLERAREQAASLVRDSRYRDAVRVLAAAAEPADRTFGAADPEVLDLRWQLADALFDAGDHHQAARVYAWLAARYAGDAERVFKCRSREAACHDHLGDPARALELTRALLTGHPRPGDDRALELRRQVGELERDTGDTGAARATLAALLADLTSLHGPAHPATARVAALLAGLAG
ncbi:serine/threonine protein kinase [Nonomuraea sp. NN258]|nr:serine/threonine protein kinase [Nonomuraea antri]